MHHSASINYWAFSDVDKCWSVINKYLVLPIHLYISTWTGHVTDRGIVALEVMKTEPIAGQTGRTRESGHSIPEDSSDTGINHWGDAERRCRRVTALPPVQHACRRHRTDLPLVQLSNEIWGRVHNLDTRGILYNYKWTFLLCRSIPLNWPGDRTMRCVGQIHRLKHVLPAAAPLKSGGSNVATAAEPFPSESVVLPLPSAINLPGGETM